MIGSIDLVCRFQTETSFHAMSRVQIPIRSLQRGKVVRRPLYSVDALTDRSNTHMKSLGRIVKVNVRLAP